MKSILAEIMRLRLNESYHIDYKNTNRYRVVFQEPNGSKTAYYFSHPIYNSQSRKLVDLSFQRIEEGFLFTGSNGKILVQNRICLLNQEGSCSMNLLQPCVSVSETELRCERDSIFATVNGIAYQADISIGGEKRFVFETSRPFGHIRANDKYFALMAEQFRPFVVISCIGTLDGSGNVIAPASMTYQKINDQTFEISISPTSPLGQYVLFECNLHEPKLLQDTTVESQNPHTNNAFGGTAFIGNTSLFGEQWLYMKMDYSKLLDIADKHIKAVTVSFPNHNNAQTELSAFRIPMRFCSFGSDWNNKISVGNLLSDAVISDGYQNVDLTALMVDAGTHTLMLTEGIILRSKIKGSGFSVISTGDSAYAPPILRVNYR